MTTTSIAGLLAATGLLAGCQSDAQNGALIGTGIGALAGYAVGNEGDKKHHHYGKSNYDY